MKTKEAKRMIELEFILFFIKFPFWAYIKQI